MSGLRRAIKLIVPGTLEFRSVAVRVVAEACRLVSGSQGHESSRAYDIRDPFDTAFVSAFMEIFNNVAIHAYARGGGGDIELTVLVGDDRLSVELRDTGRTFQLADVPQPDMESLPEGGMGIHIARTMLDEMIYVPGPPNLWRLTKQLSPVLTH